MPELQVTLTGFEVKPGESSKGPYKLTRFKADDGKNYQTFDEALADRMKERIGVSSLVTFEVQSRTSGNRTFTNNVATDIADPNAPTVDASSNGSAGGNATANRILAFAAGVKLAEALVSSGQADTIDFAGVTRAADGILAWAEGNLAGSDPEDAVPDADPSDAVPD